MHKRLLSQAGFTLASGGLFIAAWLLTNSTARAEDLDHDGRRDRVGSPTIALDLDYAASIGDHEVNNGGGGALRLGSQHDFGLITLIPELELEYHDFGARTEKDATVFAGKLGGRLRVLKIVEPGVFAHIGLGNIGGNETYSHLGAAADAGITLDLTILPLIDLGLHWQWNRIFGGYDSGFSYTTAGLHVALVL
jgi:hypothetical protein